MFEAHDFYADEVLPAVQVNQPEPDFSQPAAVHLIHSRYQCPLYIWFSPGKRKTVAGQPLPVWYIHVEYRLADGSQAYRLLEKPRETTISGALWQQLTELELAGICPLQTRAAPIGR